QTQILNVGFLLETSAASTYMSALSTLTDGQAQKLSASVLPVESQHSVAFGAGAGKAVADLVPTFILPDHPLDPTKLPVATCADAEAACSQSASPPASADVASSRWAGCPCWPLR